MFDCFQKKLQEYMSSYCENLGDGGKERVVLQKKEKPFSVIKLLFQKKSNYKFSDRREKIKGEKKKNTS
jgi:hypothetical protein